METDSMKKQLIAICDFVKLQLETGKCTASEIRDFYKMTGESLEVDATTKDISDFFGQSETNVRSVCSRNYGDKPKRRVYHNLRWFLGVCPTKWINRGNF